MKNLKTFEDFNYNSLYDDEPRPTEIKTNRTDFTHYNEEVENTIIEKISEIKAEMNSYQWLLSRVSSINGSENAKTMLMSMLADKKLNNDQSTAVDNMLTLLKLKDL